MRFIALIKKIVFVLPDPVQILFSRVIRRQLVGNRVFLDQYNELLHMDNISIFLIIFCPLAPIIEGRVVLTFPLMEPLMKKSMI